MGCSRFNVRQKLMSFCATTVSDCYSQHPTTLWNGSLETDLYDEEKNPVQLETNVMMLLLKATRLHLQNSHFAVKKYINQTTEAK